MNDVGSGVSNMRDYRTNNPRRRLDQRPDVEQRHLTSSSPRVTAVHVQPDPTRPNRCTALLEMHQIAIT